MSAPGPYVPPRRTRSVVEAELSAAEGRISGLSRAEAQGDEGAARVRAWYADRAEILRRELGLDGAGAR